MLAGELDWPCRGLHQVPWLASVSCADVWKYCTCVGRYCTCMTYERRSRRPTTPVSCRSLTLLTGRPSVSDVCGRPVNRLNVPVSALLFWVSLTSVTCHRLWIAKNPMNKSRTVIHTSARQVTQKETNHLVQYSIKLYTVLSRYMIFPLGNIASCRFTKLISARPELPHQELRSAIIQLMIPVLNVISWGACLTS